MALVSLQVEYNIQFWDSCLKGDVKYTGKVQLRGATMVQCLECICSMREVEEVWLVFPSEGEPKW